MMSMFASFVRPLLALAACAALTACSKKPVESSGSSAGSDKPAPAPNAAIADLPMLTPVNSNAVAVSVDDKQLTEGEIARRADAVIRGRGLDGAPAEQVAQFRANIRQQMVSTFVARTLLLKEAVKLNVTAAPEDVTKTITEISTNLPPGETLATVLAKENMTEEKLRADIGEELRIKKLVDKHVAALPPIGEAAITNFYAQQKANFDKQESSHARHILFACEKDDAAARTAKRAVADQVLKELKEGGDFAALAAKHSDCPSKERGGDLGTFERGQMVKAFEEAAFTQKTNEIACIETDFGYHLIQVLDRNPARTQPLDEARKSITETLQRQRDQEALQSYVESLKAKATVKMGS